MTDDYDPYWDEIRTWPGYYDRDGNPITMRQWADHIEYGNRRVLESLVHGRWRVSTIWMGLDHRLRLPRDGEDYRPLIFETMIFDLEEGGDERDMMMRRYTTEDEARAGHAELVALAESWAPDKPTDL